MRPVDASKKENETDVWEHLFRDDDIHDETSKKSNKFEIGDTVRISKIKGIFSMVSYRIDRNGVRTLNHLTLYSAVVNH